MEAQIIPFPYSHGPFTRVTGYRFTKFWMHIEFKTVLMKRVGYTTDDPVSVKMIEEAATRVVDAAMKWGLL